MSGRELGLDDVEKAFHRLFIGVVGTSLRREDRQKVAEVTGLLPLLGRCGDSLLVDAAGGKGSVGIMAAELGFARRVAVIEREPAHAALARAAAERVSVGARVSVTEGDVGDTAVWPQRSELVVALHACGPASDRVIDAAIALRVKRLVLVPCCYSDAVPFSSPARALAEVLGVPRHAEVRRRAVMAFIDAERTLRLEAAGYETVVSSFVAPAVTPHHLAWRARLSGEPKRIEGAARRLSRLRGR